MSEEVVEATQCNCGKTCTLCNGFKGDTFFTLLIRKILRNFASMKFQWLTILYVPVVYGMFDGKWVTLTDGTIQWVSKISPSLGLGFLGGGFLSLATSRIIARTKLTEPVGNGELDTDK